MIGESELERLESQLRAFRVSERQRAETEQSVLSKYEELLESYRRLRSDYEEEREARERYKKLARGQERNPFVLVLIDLDGYIFNDHLVKAGKDGGPEAAQLLKDAIKESIHSIGEERDRCRIMFRGYTNLQSLSVRMAREGLTGHEARSLAPFAASFTRSEDLFDITDSGEKKEGADFKLKEVFRLFADNNQCRHIYFGGCHDPGYLSLLSPWRGRSDKVSLIRATSFQTEYLSLGLGIVDFPTVFRSMTEFKTLASAQTMMKTSSQTKPTSLKVQTSQKGTNGEQKTCAYFQQTGKCRYGDSCKFSHSSADQRQGPDLFSSLHKSIHSSDWRSPPSTDSNSPVKTEANGQLGRRLVSTALPINSLQNAGLIPLNRNDERLDTYLAPPTTEQWERFNQRVRERKLCNQHHLNGLCLEMDRCQYDHSPVNSEILHALRYVAHNTPCSRAGACRKRTCVGGHICQKDGCQGGAGCKLRYKMHSIDPVAVTWVHPVDDTFTDNSNVSHHEDEDDSNNTLIDNFNEVHMEEEYPSRVSSPSPIADTSGDPFQISSAW